MSRNMVGKKPLVSEGHANDARYTPYENKKIANQKNQKLGVFTGSWWEATLTLLLLDKY